MANVSAQLCRWQVEQPVEGRAPRLPNKAVLCSFPLPSVPATALPALWAQNLRAISGPFGGRPGLGKSEVLAARHNCLP